MRLSARGVNLWGLLCEGEEAAEAARSNSGEGSENHTSERCGGKVNILLMREVEEF